MYIGAHLSSAGGIHTAVDRAETVGAESLQVFTQSPRAWRPTNHDPATFDRFRERREEVGLHGVLCHALYLCNFATNRDDVYEKSVAALRNTMEIATAIGADGVVLHVGSHLGAGLDAGMGRVLPAMEQVLELTNDTTWLLMENSAGTGGTIGRSIEELATLYERLDRHPRLGLCLDSCHLYASGIDVTDASRARRAARRGRRLDRARPPACTACQRLRRAARVEPRPAREHRRGAARREPRRLSLEPPAAGPARDAGDLGPRQPRPGRERGPQGKGDSRTRYRWVILGAGTLAQASFSALSVGLPALAPALRAHYRLTLGETGVVLGAVGIGMLFTLLPWGLLADRLSEQVVIAIGLTLSGCALIVAGRTHSYLWLVVTLFAAGAFGASVNAASGRAVMGWFPADQRGLALGVRQTAIPIGGAAAAAGLPWLADAGGTRLAFIALGCSCVGGAVVAACFIRGTPAPGADLTNVTAPMRDPRMWLLGLGSGFYLTAQIAITGFIVLFLHEHRGVSARSAAALLAAINLLGILARILSGRWSDRVRTRLRPMRLIGVAARGRDRDRRRLHRCTARAAHSCTRRRGGIVDGVERARDRGRG